MEPAPGPSPRSRDWSVHCFVVLAHGRAGILGCHAGVRERSLTNSPVTLCRRTAGAATRKPSTPRRRRSRSTSASVLPPPFAWQ